jgi:hypothetical protein
VRWFLEESRGSDSSPTSTQITRGSWSRGRTIARYLVETVCLALFGYLSGVLIFWTLLPTWLYDSSAPQS